MRRIILTSLLSIILHLVVTAQSNFELSFDAQKVGNDIEVSYFIEKTSGPDFLLGATNLPLIFKNSKDIQWTSVSLDNTYPSPFGQSGNPGSYRGLVYDGSKYLHLTILPVTNTVGSGQIVSTTKLKVASLLIPVSGSCPETDLYWEKNLGAINSYSNNATPNSIKSGATFIDPLEVQHIFYDIPSKPQLSYVDSLSACKGNSVTLYTTNDGFDLQWIRDGIVLNGANDTILYASSSGTYSVQSQNCSISKVSDVVKVNIIPSPEKAVITENNGVLTSSVTQNIQWFHNGLAIPNATSPILTPSNSGIYIVESRNVCGIEISDPFNFAPLNVDFSQNGPSLRVFPNPYIGKTNIELTLMSDTDLTVEVYDLKGNLVSLVSGGLFEKGRHQLNFSAQALGRAAGTYVLKVRTNEKELVQNLVELK